MGVPGGAPIAIGAAPDEKGLVPDQNMETLVLIVPVEARFIVRTAPVRQDRLDDDRSVAVESFGKSEAEFHPD